MSIFIFVIYKIFIIFLIFKDKSYSLFVINNTPDLPLDRTSLFPPGQLDAITTRSLLSASIIELLQPSKKMEILKY